jgi:hypothetical protein
MRAAAGLLHRDDGPPRSTPHTQPTCEREEDPVSRVSPTPIPFFTFEFRLPSGDWELSGAKPLPGAEADERLTRLTADLPGAEYRLAPVEVTA